MIREVSVLAVAELLGILRVRALAALAAASLALTLFADHSTVFWIDAPPGTTREIALDFAWMGAGLATLLGMYCHQLHGARASLLMRMRLRSDASVPLAGLAASVTIGTTLWVLCSGVTLLTTAEPLHPGAPWWQLTAATFAFVVLVAALSTVIASLVRPAVTVPVCLAIVATTLTTPSLTSYPSGAGFVWPDFALLQVSHDHGPVVAIRSIGLAGAHALLFTSLALLINAIRRD